MTPLLPNKTTCPKSIQLPSLWHHFLLQDFHHTPKFLPRSCKTIERSRNGTRKISNNLVSCPPSHSLPLPFKRLEAICEADPPGAPMAAEIHATPCTDLESECKQLRELPGRSLSSLIRAVAGRTQMEKRQMRETYEAMYGEGLTEGLANGDGGSVVESLYLWMLEPHERDAIVVRKALQQGRTNYRALVEIFVGRKSSQIFLVAQAYEARFKSKLEQDLIAIDPPHSYQRILLGLAASHKAHRADDVYQHTAMGDAKRLYERGEGSMGGCFDEALVLEILSKRSIPQLRLTFSSYRRIYGHAYAKSLKKGNYGEFPNALRTAVKCICDPPNYYAKILKTDKKAMERVILSRADIDLVEIRELYQRKYGIELKEAICRTVSLGDFRTFLMELTSNSTSALNYM